MATATAVSTVTKINLELTADEAAELRATLGPVSGGRHLYSIYHALGKHVSSAKVRVEGSLSVSA